MAIGWDMCFLDEKDSTGAGNALGEWSVFADTKFQETSPFVGI
jgi:hypothetical protein